MDKLIDTQNYILVLLELLGGSVDLIRLNKIAFLVEFEYFFKNDAPLTTTQYAAINLGPVIDGYRDVLADMESSGKVSLSKFNVVSEHSPKNLSASQISFIKQTVSKYSQLSNKDLIAITHGLDSYIITSNAETDMGHIIDKSLSHLDLYFGQSDDAHDLLLEEETLHSD